jgi:glycosyltransferase involved in cell wall biosynthesis
LFFGSGQINALFSPFLFLFPNRCKTVARESNIPTQFENFFILKLFYKYFYKNYDKVIVQSDDMFFDLNSNFNIPISKLIKINNPVDVSFVKSKLNSKDIALFPEGKYNILLAGRLTYQKGFDLFLNKIAEIKDVNFHVTILGDGEDKLSLLELVDTLNLKDKTSFKGNVDNPYEYMQKADLFILSSRFEGFPNVVLEALCCGTPVLSNNCLGGINEIVKPGFNGDIFTYDSNDFKNKLKQISIASFDSEILHKDIFDRFSVDKKIKSFESVFKSLYY